MLIARLLVVVAVLRVLLLVVLRHLKRASICVAGRDQIVFMELRIRRQQ